MRNGKQNNVAPAQCLETVSRLQHRETQVEPRGFVSLGEGAESIGRSRWLKFTEWSMREERTAGME